MLREDNRVLVHRREAVDAASLLDWTSLFERSDYPADAEQRKLFYRQADSLVALLYDRSGIEGMQKLLALVCERAVEPDQAYRELNQMDEAAWLALLNEAEQEAVKAFP